MRGGTVAVVGGSVAGCAAALAAERCGADEIVLYERAAGGLQDRGVGLAIQDDRFDELVAAGYLDGDIPWVRLLRRRWFSAGPGLGREFAVQPFVMRSYRWGSLWRGLRARVPARVTYRSSAEVVEVVPEAGGAVVRTRTGGGGEPGSGRGARGGRGSGSGRGARGAGGGGRTGSGRGVGGGRELGSGRGAGGAGGAGGEGESGSGRGMGGIGGVGGGWESGVGRGVGVGGDGGAGGVGVGGAGVGAGVGGVGGGGGEVRRFDLVVGADGYRSVVRRAMFPDVRPEYAGYVLWRGTFPAAWLDGSLAAAWPAADAITVGIPRGHAIAFRIPGADGDVVNWGLYSVPPPSAARLDDPTTLPPGSVTGELMAHFARLVAEHLPPDWARIVRLTPREELYVQPIYDLSLPALASGRLLLAGDAAACARPHTGGGAVKALQDAVALEDAWRAAATWDELRTAYDAARAPGARAIVDLGRRLGHAQVPAAPDWTAMDAAALDAWWGEISSAGGFGGLALRRD